MRTIGPMEVLIVLLTLVIFLVPMVFYLLTLQRAFDRCAPEARTMPSARVWLQLIPIFGLVWSFVVVTNLAKSLANEFARRGITPPESEPGKNLGLAMSGLMVSTMIPLIGIVTGLLGVVVWILYWVRISDYSNRLRSPSI